MKWYVLCVDDIGETAVIEDEAFEEKGILRKVVEDEFDGVQYSDEYDGCIVCNAKVKGEDELLAKCTKY